MHISRFVSLLRIKNRYALSHSLTVEQVFGGKKLKKFYQNFGKRNFNREEFENFFLDTKLFDKLVKAKILIRDEKDDDKLLERIYQNNPSLNNKQNRYSLLRILLTDICNLNCAYCKVERNIKQKIKRSTPRKKLAYVIKILAESKTRNPKIIHITGGEPTIFPPEIKFIVDTVRKYDPEKKINLIIGTNATLMTGKIADYIAANKMKIIVSLDGPERINNILRVDHSGKGSYQRVIAGLNIIRKRKIEYGLSMVIGGHNIKKLQSTINWIVDNFLPSSLGVNFMKPPTPGQTDFCYLIPPKIYAKKIYNVFQKIRNRNVYLELVMRKIEPFVYQKFKYYDCGASAGTTINVDAKGNIGPCKSFLIMEKDFSGTTKQTDYLEILNRWRKRSPVFKSECQNCPMIGICGNGCAYESFVYNKNYDELDPQSCAYVKDFFHLMIADLDSIYRKKYHIDEEVVFIPSKKDRLLILGKSRRRQNTLKWSIGHATTN
ncbi:hypothetical protein COV53_00420 [Candidatus Gottesmanbacteria bacterium CG11_big_fil_rev_8_21_14_0_20_37_11]|uniref:Radical SAM core domain-containing protein n=1 Tax=Candidatus Gottesmanbacteria bacterium CG11_big_fil_rev_8_21_14_0_20_37_11 TaxID=1974575 RepID=A0A2H0NJA3_9BACT|nr:MAG: hypothetical protein COV53_00420 [Candidatus Gottesmanbacteria bacterium CG11_big_fil_rev_8_21_14_0_20_37_11]